MKAMCLFYLMAFTMVIPGAVKAQFACVTGKICDRATGESIRQVSVTERITGIGTLSSENGLFSLYLKPGAVELLFSEEGYAAVTAGFELSGDTVLQVTMDPREPESLKKGRREAMMAQNPLPVTGKQQGRNK